MGGENEKPKKTIVKTKKKILNEGDAVRLLLPSSPLFPSFVSSLSSLL
jgi:hypothetical protein